MASDSLDLFIAPDGTVTAVYDDALVDLFPGVPLETRRASHVEPWSDGWAADMAPAGGPMLLAGPGVPFRTRQAALDAERAWLDARLREGAL